MGKKACHWLLSKLEQTVLDRNSRHFFEFKEGDIVYMFQMCSNAFGNYIFVTELKVGGCRRLVIIPEGKVMRGWRRFDFELTSLITPKKPMKILDGMHKHAESNVNVSRSFVAVIRGEKQKTTVASDSRPLAIDKGKSINEDLLLVAQNPVKTIHDKKERNQNKNSAGKPMSIGEGLVQSIKIHPKLVENFQTRSPL
ncbi:hypothetical protein CMV_027667 [Castanea mollissima]|uniref:Uncharacterized protein n=1 Tax=Castanea mollissima TaxID=60419 RepID=A0A8J4VCY3_9ROSI|nr:hypothetical protein CMV_027667 [Castanea mollissima]